MNWAWWPPINFPSGHSGKGIPSGEESRAILEYVPCDLFIRAWNMEYGIPLRLLPSLDGLLALRLSFPRLLDGGLGQPYGQQRDRGTLTVSVETGRTGRRTDGRMGIRLDRWINGWMERKYSKGGAIGYPIPYNL